MNPKNESMPFFPFGKQVAFNGKFGQRILFQCVSVGDSKKLSDLLNEAYKSSGVIAGF